MSSTSSSSLSSWQTQDYLILLAAIQKEGLEVVNTHQDWLNIHHWIQTCSLSSSYLKESSIESLEWHYQKFMSQSFLPFTKTLSLELGLQILYVKRYKELYHVLQAQDKLLREELRKLYPPNPSSSSTTPTTPLPWHTPPFLNELETSLENASSSSLASSLSSLTCSSSSHSSMILSNEENEDKSETTFHPTHTDQIHLNPSPTSTSTPTTFSMEENEIEMHPSKENININKNKRKVGWIDHEKSTPTFSSEEEEMEETEHEQRERKKQKIRMNLESVSSYENSTETNKDILETTMNINLYEEYKKKMKGIQLKEDEEEEEEVINASFTKRVDPSFPLKTFVLRDSHQNENENENKNEMNEKYPHFENNLFKKEMNVNNLEVDNGIQIHPSFMTTRKKSLMDKEPTTECLQKEDLPCISKKETWFHDTPTLTPTVVSSSSPLLLVKEKDPFLNHLHDVKEEDMDPTFDIDFGVPINKEKDHDGCSMPQVSWVGSSTKGNEDPTTAITMTTTSPPPHRDWTDSPLSDTQTPIPSHLTTPIEEVLVSSPHVDPHDMISTPSTLFPLLSSPSNTSHLTLSSSSNLSLTSMNVSTSSLDSPTLTTTTTTTTTHSSSSSSTTTSTMNTTSSLSSLSTPTTPPPLPPSMTSTSSHRAWRRLALHKWDDIANTRLGHPFFNLLSKRHHQYQYPHHPALSHSQDLSSSSSSWFGLSHQAIRSPMDLKTLRMMVRENKVVSTDQFHRNVLLMIANTCMMYPESNPFHQMALEMKLDIEKEMKTFKSVETAAALKLAMSSGWKMNDVPDLLEHQQHQQEQEEEMVVGLEGEVGLREEVGEDNEVDELEEQEQEEEEEDEEDEVQPRLVT